MDHPVELGDLEVAVADHRIIDSPARGFLNILLPALVIVHRIDRNADELHTSLVELMLHPRHRTEFGGTDGSEVLGVRETHGPRAVDIVMKADPAFCGIRLEIRYNVAELQCHVTLLSKFVWSVL